MKPETKDLLKHDEELVELINEIREKIPEMRMVSFEASLLVCAYHGAYDLQRNPGALKGSGIHDNQ